jgi:hypothetical protein
VGVAWDHVPAELWRDVCQVISAVSAHYVMYVMLNNALTLAARLIITL